MSSLPGAAPAEKHPLKSALLAGSKDSRSFLLAQRVYECPFSLCTFGRQRRDQLARADLAPLAAWPPSQPESGKRGTRRRVATLHYSTCISSEDSLAQDHPSRVDRDRHRFLKDFLFMKKVVLFRNCTRMEKVGSSIGKWRRD